MQIPALFRVIALLRGMPNFTLRVGPESERRRRRRVVAGMLLCMFSLVTPAIGQNGVTDLRWVGTIDNQHYWDAYNPIWGWAWTRSNGTREETDRLSHAYIENDYVILHSSETVEELTIGYGTGTAELIIDSWGRLSVYSGRYSGGATVTLARDAGSTGRLNIGGGYDGEAGHFSANVEYVTGARIWGGAGNASVDFNHTGTIDFDAAFSGSLTVTKGGAGTTHLTGITSHFGGTQIYEGALVIGNGGTSGILTGNVNIVNDYAMFGFNRSDSSVYGGVVSGAGYVTKGGGGTLTLTGNNTYTGGTTVYEGVLQLGDGGASGHIAGSVNLVNDDVTLAFNRSDAYTFGGLIHGVGGVSMRGTGTVTLTGNNTYSGGTLITNGTLVVNNESNLGSGSVSIHNGALTGTSFSFNQSVAVHGSGSSLTSADGQWLEFGSSTGPGGSGELHVANGGSVSSGGNLNLGFYQGNSGSVTVTGTGSRASAAGLMRIGVSGNGTITIEDGAVVVPNWLRLAEASSSTGVLHLNEGGILQVGGTDGIYAGAGEATFNFAGGTIELLADFSTSVDMTLSNTSTVDTSSHDGTFSGTLSGDGALVKAGAGTLTLSGENTYSGGTTVEAGNLRVGDGGETGSLIGNLSVAEDAQLVVDRSGVLALGGSISGEGTLVKNGTGTLALTGGNTHTGGTTVASGILQIGQGGETGSIAGNVGVAGGAHLVIDRAGQIVLGGVISGDGNVTKSGGGTLIFTGNHSYAGGTSIEAGTLQLGNGGNSGTAGTGAISVAAGANLTLDRSDDFNFNQSLSGAGAFIKRGDGQVTLTGTNSHNGGTIVSAGTLQVDSADRLGTGPVSVTSGGTLIGSQFEFNTDVSVDGAGSSLSTNPNWLEFGSGGTGSLSVRNGGSVSAGANLNIGYYAGDSGDVSISGTGSVINVGGSLRVGISGTGSLTIAEGGQVNAPRLVIGEASGGSGTVELASGGTLRIGGTNELRFGEGTGLFQLAGGTIELDDDLTTSIPMTLSNTSRIDTAGHAGTFSGTLSGDGALVKSGVGMLTLSGENTYSGRTTIMAGTLQVGNGGASGSLSGDIKIAGNGGLIFNRSDDLTFGGDIEGFDRDSVFTKSGSGNLILTGDLVAVFGDTYINEGTLTFGDGDTGGMMVANIVNNASLVFNYNHDMTYTATTGISGPGSVTKTGSGTLTLASAYHTHTGGTTVEAGTLQFGDGGTTGSMWTGPSEIQIAGGANVAANWGGAVEFENVFAGEGGFIKRGTGTTTLTGSNTYTGGTTIEAGTLQIGNGGASGSLAGDIEILGSAGLVFNRSGELTFGGDIEGFDTGTLTKTGSGNAILTGIIAPWGGIRIDEGTLTFGDGETVGQLSASIVNSASLVFDHNHDFSYIYGLSISGTGSLTKTGSGTLTLARSLSTYTGGTTVEAGTLQLGDGSDAGPFVAAGTGDISIFAGANLAVNRADSFDLGNALSGEGGFIKRGTGTVTMTGVNTYTGLTRIEEGVFTFGAGSYPSGAGAVEIRDGGILRGGGLVVTSLRGDGSLEIPSGTFWIDEAESHAFAGTISGNGGITKRASGTLTLSGENTFTGDIVISDGTLSVGSSSHLGDSANKIYIDGGTLRATGSFSSDRDIAVGGSGGGIDVSGGAALAVSGAVSGGGDLTKSGTGTLTLGNLSTSGSLTVDAGRLALPNGGQFGSLLVNANAAFDSLGPVESSVINHGTIGALGGGTLRFSGNLSGAGGYAGDIAIAGNFSPGNSPSLIAVDGNLTFENSSVLTMEIGGLERGMQYDAFDVAGTLTFGGTLEAIFIDDFEAIAGDTFQLFDSISFAGSFETLQLAELAPGLAWNTADLASFGTISVSAVPEPATVALLGGFAIFGFVFWRRRVVSWIGSGKLRGLLRPAARR